MKKILTKVVGLALGLAMTVGVGARIANNRKASPVYADEVVYKDIQFGSSYNSNGVSSYTATWSATKDGFTVNLANFNNYNNGWDYVKCGRKNNASVATIITGAVIDEAVTKVDVTIDAITAANVNSIKLYTSANGSSWTDEGSYTKGTGIKSVALASPTEDLYYKIEFDCASGSANGLVTVSKIEYYHNESSGGEEPPTPSTYTVTYDANGGTGTMTDGDSPYTSGATVTVLDNEFTRDGYVFDHWDTKADDSGADYDEGDTFEISANITLYAQWLASNLTVTYNANGADSGDVPEDNTNYVSNTSVTVLGNIGNLSKTDKFWAGWNTKSDGTGITYNPGDSFTISANTTLYAKWEDELDDLTGQSGTINFGSADGSLNVNFATVSRQDNLGVTWTVKTVGTTSYTPNSGYAQIGSSSSPATSITFESCNLQSNYKIKAFSAKFGGFSNTAGDISLKVGNEEVGTGELSGTTDVTVSNTIKEVGSKLSITVTNIAKGVKAYYISYTLAAEVETQTLSATSMSAYDDETITISSDADEAVTWSIVSGAGTTAVGADITSGGVVSVTGPGTVTVKAVASGYNDATIQVTFNEKPANIHQVTFDSDGGSESPAAKNVADGEIFTFPSPGTKEHYTFDGWTSDLSNYYQPGDSSPAVTGDVEYVGFWSEDPIYTITYSAGLHGNGTPYIDVDYGGTYTLPEFASLTGLSADSGYRFKDYTVGGNQKNPGETFELSANTAVTVNFEEIPLAYELSFPGTYSASSLTEITTDETMKNLYPSFASDVVTSGFSKVYGKANLPLKLGSNNNPASITFTIPFNKRITSVVIGLSTTVASADLQLTSGANNAQTESQEMVASETLTFDDYFAAEKSNSFTLVSSAKGAFGIVSIVINYANKTTNECFETTETLSAMKFDYTDLGGGSYDIQNAGIRFGGFVNEDLWSQLENVEGYGVIIVNHSSLGEDSIKDKYNAKKAAFAADALDNDTVDDILAAICTDLSAQKASANGSSPAYADAKQKAFMGVGESDTYRVWTLLKDIGSAFTTEFTAVAYIKIDGDILFLQETTTSMKQLATARFSTLDPEVPYYGAIQYMKVND